MKKVLDFCNITGESVKEYEGERNYIATGDVVDNKIISFEKVTYKNKPSRANQNVKVGDVLFAKMKDTQKVVIIDEDNVRNIYSTGFFVITPEKDVRSEYLYWLFNSNKFNEQKNKNCKGATQKALNNEGFSKILIKEIPSIKEQEKIVDKLNKVQEIIDIKIKQMEKLDKLIKSQFVELFGDISSNEYKYETKKLEEVAKVGSSHRVFTTEFVGKGIPFYRGTEIGQLANGVVPENPYYISEEHYLKICDNDTKPKIGDLLIPSICDKGQVWMVDTEKPFYYKDGRVLSISPKYKKLNHKYFQYFMKLKTEIEYPKLGSGSTFAEFKIFILKNLDIVLPPIELQNQFADFLKLIDKQKFELQKSLEEMQELQESLMNKYFN